MKRKSFTLVELLVTIGIIVLLAGILLPAVSGALKKADSAKAKASITTLVNAIKQYEATYGRLPIPATGYTEGSFFTRSDNNNSDSDRASEDCQYSWLINVLQNQSLTTAQEAYGTLNNANPRHIKFLDVTGNQPGVFQDPWNEDFYVVFDTNYNDQITTTNGVTGLQGAGSSNTEYYYSVIVYSTGPDRRPNNNHTTGRGNNSSDRSKKVNKDNIYSVPTTWDKSEGHQPGK